MLILGREKWNRLSGVEKNFIALLEYRIGSQIDCLWIFHAVCLHPEKKKKKTLQYRRNFSARTRVNLVSIKRGWNDDLRARVNDDKEMRGNNAQAFANDDFFFSNRALNNSGVASIDPLWIFKKRAKSCPAPGNSIKRQSLVTRHPRRGDHIVSVVSTVNRQADVY